MPVIAANYEELVGLIGKRIPKGDLVARVPMMGGAYDGEDENGRLLFEFFPNRPDLLSIEGLARACRAFFDVKPGLATFEVRPSKDVVRVDASVAQVRPYLGFARVGNVSLDENRLEQLIELQERLTTGPGRKRRKVAIGIHDAARVVGPFSYRAVGRQEVRFVPLGMQKALTPDEILAQHEKGRLYAPLLAGQEKVPLITDGKGQVLSMPPVINGELTALTTSTREVIVDVTGTEERAVQGILNIIVTGLAERGGTISSFTLEQGKAKVVTPDLGAQETQLEYERVRSVLGLSVTPAEAKTYLGRMGHEAEPSGPKGARVRSPAYRLDLLHADDLVEDLGIGYGFDKFKPRLPERALFGGLVASTKRMRRARTLLLGHGFTEVVTLTVTGRRDAFELVGEKPGPVVSIANPLTLEQAILRPRLAPSLLGILRANKHRELPQSVFEVGHVVPDVDGGAKTQLRAAALRMSRDANFSECKGIVEAVLRDLDIQASLEPGAAPGFLAGRSAILRGPDGKTLGHFGELRPETITGFELGAPVIGFEFIL